MTQHLKKRKEIKRLLSRLDEKNRHVFKLMYSHKDLEKDIDLIVDDMPSNKVSWALQQCQNSYYKIFRILKKS